MDKVIAIQKLDFPSTLKQLKTYLGMTGWLRSYAPYYSQLAESFQERKIKLLKTHDTRCDGKKSKAQDRKSYVIKTSWISISQERNSFKVIQKIFAQLTFLIHHDPERRLYVDTNGSKDFSMVAMVYHVKGNRIDQYPRTSV